MPMYVLTLVSLGISALFVLLTASWLVRFRLGNEGIVGASAQEQAIRLSLGIILILVSIVNLSLWVPGRIIHLALIATAAMAVPRLWSFRAQGGWRVLYWIACLVILVVFAGWMTTLRVDAEHYWLVETSNHDTLFYYEGARWAAQNAVYADPSVVADKLGLGSCRLGAVYVGNDCPVYRAGTFSMLAQALAYGGGTSANDMLVSASLGILLLGAGFLPLIVQSGFTGKGASILWASVCFAILAIVYFSPTLMAAAINSNVATTFGAAAAGMVLALSLHEDQVWWRRPLMTGFGAAFASHVYGEAAGPAVIVAAIGVINFSLSDKSLKNFIRDGAVCASAFFIGANIVIVQLLRSARDVNAIAAGGQWEGMYLHASPWTWLASPFAGMVVNGSPYVTKGMLGNGLTLAALVIVASLFAKRTRGALLAVLVVGVLLVSFVEIRQYAYGEHKVVQMIGTLACVLAAGAAIISIRRAFTVVRTSWTNVSGLVGGLILLLMLSAIWLQLRPSLQVIASWKTLHGLSSDFQRDLQVRGADADWVIDDTGTSSVERFQKSHYIAYLIHASKGHAYLPKLDQEGMRGGYTRRVLGNTLARLQRARWLVQLKSFDGVFSPFVYPPQATIQSTEYSVVDLEKTSPALAVSGWGWLPCNGQGCPVASGFEIEALSWARQGEVCALRVSGHPLPTWPKATFKLSAEGAQVIFAREMQWKPEGILLPLSRGWQRFRFDDGANTPGALWQVTRAAVECRASSESSAAGVDHSSAVVGKEP